MVHRSRPSAGGLPVSSVSGMHGATLQVQCEFNFDQLCNNIPWCFMACRLTLALSISATLWYIYI
jgi:hypothetical protein